MLQITAITIENVPLAERTFRIRLRSSRDCRRHSAGAVRHAKLPGMTDPLLGRPFALYDVVGDAIDIVYLVVGKMTAKLADVKAGRANRDLGPARQWVS